MSGNEKKKQKKYEEAKELANSKDPAVRAALAKRRDLPPELLYFLAEDNDVDVRRTVAKNAAAPELTHIILAKDEAQDVRSQLAAKIAKSYQNPSAELNDKSKQMTLNALSRLANDQITAVRSALADAIKDIPGAPSDIILKIACDREIIVSGPVLEHSPVLTDNQLIDIITAPSAEGALSFISKRQGVNIPVSNAIISSGDTRAIGELLSNNSAYIQESILDQLVDQAEGVKLWHAPLVSRQTLPKTAAARLAQFVASNLLDELQKRTDIDKDVMADVKRAVQDRLDGAEFELDDNVTVPAQDFLTMEIPLDLVKRLVGSRMLDVKVIERALDAGDYSFVLAALVINSDVDERVAKLIFKDKRAQAIISLCMLAQFPVSILVKVQQHMGKIPPKDILLPKDDVYPLTNDEVMWQIEFYSRLAKK